MVEEITLQILKKSYKDGTLKNHYLNSLEEDPCYLRSVKAI